MSTRKKTRKKPTKRRKKIPKRDNKRVWTLILFLTAFIVCSILWLQYEHQKPHGVTVTPGSTSSSVAISTTSGLEVPRFTDNKNEQIITHTGFTVSYSENHRVPYWVGYQLTVDETFGQNSRTDRFVPDPKLKVRQAHTSDYTRSGYDRGHMAPAADMKWSRDAMTESFYLTNICPQHPELNRRAWKQLEERVRQWAQADSLLVVVSGPLLSDKCTRIGKNKVSIPDGFFKVVLSPFASPPQAIGFLFGNKRAVDPLSAYAVPVDSVEIVSGLDFFHQLPDSIERMVEGGIQLSYWDL